MISKSLSLGLVVIALVITGAPVHARAATIDQPSYTSMFEEWARHTSSRSSRERYSSAIERAIKKLDDKPVESLPIPILMGIHVSNLSKNFGDPRDGGARTHEGLDIMAPMGSFVASPTDAVVVRTGDGSSSGIYVTTANPGGETFTYMHLSRIRDGVKAGTVLKPGDLIGYVGNTGNAAGGPAHLHFEIRKDRKATDPYPRLTKEFSSEERIRALTLILKELQKQLADAR